jgi:hypothetical protein
VASGNGVRAVTMVTPARLLAFTDSVAAAAAVDAEGSRRVVVHGMRLLERSDGTIERGDQLLPPRKNARTLELPKRLGGGFLFYVDEAGTNVAQTSIWRSPTWTGKLEPFANLGFDVSQMVAGFDRLYVIDKRSGEVYALDPETGKIEDPGPLPPSPSYSSMAFADAWLGAVDVPLRGVLASFDAGTSWQPLGSGAQAVGLENGELLVRTPEGDLVLDATGLLRQRARDTSEAPFQPGAREGALRAVDESEREETPVPPGPLGRQPLRSAVLHGWPDSATTAIVARDGTLGRVRLRDGKVLDVAERTHPEGGSCHAVPVLNGFGFVCGEERGTTTIYAFEPPLSLRPLASFDEPRYVAASGNGALVIRGSCPDDATEDVPGAYCILGRDGRVRPVVVRGDLGVERVAALRNGTTAVIVPPRLGAPGLLTIVDQIGNSQSVRLKLPSRDRSVLALLKKGLWLDGFIESKAGVLSGWVVAAGPFAGVRIQRDGTVEVGRISHDIDRAVLAGPFAMVLARAGAARESVDGGFRWRELELPVDLENTSRKSTSGEQRSEQGCTPVGCAFSDWLRIGWGGPGEVERLETVDAPDPTPRPNPGGARWVVSCTPAGEMSAPSKGVAEQSPAVRFPRFAVPPGTPGDELESANFRWFLEVAPPARRAGEVGFDYGTESDLVQLRAYAWGARGSSWDRVGRWQVRVADRFSIAQGVWSTEPTRSPWPDAATAAQTFGADPTSTAATHWKTALEPSGRAAVLVISARSTTEMFLLEEDRSIITVRDANKPAPYGEPLSVAKIGSTWFLGAPSGSQTFRLFKIEGDRIEVLREYPLRLAGATAAVVRQSRGTGLGIAIKRTNLFVYPIDSKTGEPGEALEVPAPALAQLPTACDTEQEGWLFTEPPGIAPYVEFSAGAEAVKVRANSLEVRLIVSMLGICTEGLAGRAELPVPGGAARKAPPSNRSAGVPLVLSDRSPAGRRWGFRCHQ